MRAYAGVQIAVAQTVFLGRPGSIRNLASANREADLSSRTRIEFSLNIPQIARHCRQRIVAWFQLQSRPEFRLLLNRFDLTHGQRAELESRAEPPQLQFVGKAHLLIERHVRIATPFRILRQMAYSRNSRNSRKHGEQRVTCVRSGWRTEMDLRSKASLRRKAGPGHPVRIRIVVERGLLEHFEQSTFF